MKNTRLTGLNYFANKQTNKKKNKEKKSHKETLSGNLTGKGRETGWKASGNQSLRNRTWNKDSGETGFRCATNSPRNEKQTQGNITKNTKNKSIQTVLRHLNPPACVMNWSLTVFLVWVTTAIFSHDLYFPQIWTHDNQALLNVPWNMFFFFFPFALSRILPFTESYF